MHLVFCKTVLVLQLLKNPCFVENGPLQTKASSSSFLEVTDWRPTHVKTTYAFIHYAQNQCLPLSTVLKFDSFLELLLISLSYLWAISTRKTKHFSHSNYVCNVYSLHFQSTAIPTCELRTTVNDFCPSVFLNIGQGFGCFFLSDYICDASTALHSYWMVFPLWPISVKVIWGYYILCKFALLSS